MRLIDADELLKPVGSYQRVKYTNEYGDVVTVEDIELMPSIDAVPVRHGKWENSRPDAPMFGFYYCSLCGRKRTSPQDRYCPNCGARMDERKEE